MTDTIWIALYVIAALLSVPFLARINSWSRESEGDSIDVGLAIICAYAWPAYLVAWIIYKMSNVLAPYIFKR